MKSLIILLCTVSLLVLFWVAWSVWITRGIETPSYKVVRTVDSIEVREYEPYLIAEVQVSGPYKAAINDGFRIIADYIFGNNVSETPLAMTAPVTEENAGEPIAMTTPVTEETTADELHLVSFVMPSKYSLENIPKPVDARVILKEVPKRRVAVLRFKGTPTAQRVQNKKDQLKAILDRLEVRTQGEVIFAGYNPPFSFPPLIKNEVMVVLEENPS